MERERKCLPKLRVRDLPLRPKSSSRILPRKSKQKQMTGKHLPLPQGPQIPRDGRSRPDPQHGLRGGSGQDSRVSSQRGSSEHAVLCDHDQKGRQTTESIPLRSDNKLISIFLAGFLQ